MFPAAYRLAGGNEGVPDVCNVPGTPPVATPFANMGDHGQVLGFSEIVKTGMGNAFSIRAEVGMTSGMEAGSASPIKGKGSFTAGSPVVYIEMLNAVRLTSQTTGNNGNNALGAVLIPGAVNVTFAYQQAGARRAGDGERLDEALRAAEVRGRVLPGGVGHVTVTAFAGGVPSAVFHEVRALVRQGMTALVLDLRGNRGGDLDAALRLADDFLERGEILARTLDEDGDEIVHRARQGDPCRLPLVVLVDRATASASELFAGCMQAHGRAVVVGERTFGKGTVQRLQPGGDGLVDAGFVALPDGKPIQGFGVSPDVYVTADPLSDRALDAAIAAAVRQSSRAARGAALPSIPEVR